MERAIEVQLESTREQRRHANCQGSARGFHDTTASESGDPVVAIAVQYECSTGITDLLHNIPRRIEISGVSPEFLHLGQNRRAFVVIRALELPEMRAVHRLDRLLHGR